MNEDMEQLIEVEDLGPDIFDDNYYVQETRRQYKECIAKLKRKIVRCKRAILRLKRELACLPVLDSSQNKQ